MLDINKIRENKEEVKKNLARREVKFDLDGIMSLDDKRRKLLTEVEQLKAERNKVSKVKPTPEVIKKMRQVGGEIEVLDYDIKKTEEELKQKLSELPNLVADDVPVGKDETENVIIRKWGKPKDFDFEPKNHMEITGLLDIASAAKITGSRFAYLKGEAVLLEFALVQHTLKTLTSEEILKKIADSVENGYSVKPFIPVVPPVMIRPEVFSMMGRLTEADKKERYYLEKDKLYLVGSAEHTLGPLHMGEVIEEKELPIRYIGFSTSFRREAGSYGKDTKGILRLHQFDKLEMESFTTPEDSLKEQNFLVAIQEYLMQSLEIPYQVVMICTGDMGTPDARQIDIEAWIPSQKKYRETHTSDLTTDYQSRRLNTRFKRTNNKTEFVHMNDATAFAIGRTLIAVLENFQQKDGSVRVPKVLQKYTGFSRITGSRSGGKVIRPKR